MNSQKEEWTAENKAIELQREGQNGIAMQCNAKVVNILAAAATVECRDL